MPSEKALQQKKALVEELSEKLKNAVSGVVVDYKGISVADDTKLRSDLRQAGVEYFVVKNTMLRFASENAGLSELHSVLEGTTALAISTDDVVAPAKVLNKYAEDSKGAFKIKAGFVEGKVVNDKEVEAIAKLPSKEVLIAQVLGGLNGVIRNFAVVLDQIREQKEAC